MLLSVNHVFKDYSYSAGFFQHMKKSVLHDVSFQLEHGEILGLVGESGSGKSTLARLICGIERPDKGEILLNNEPVYRRKSRQGNISVVFQDYFSSVNPTMTVLEAVCEPLLQQGNISLQKQHEYAAEFLAQTGLSPDCMFKHIHQLSGGEAQRVCICRALISNPALIVLDEAVSSLDVVTQVKLLDLLIKLKQDLNLSYFFITHNIQVLCYLCERVLFFHNGAIIEQCEVSQLPSVKHEYAKRLLNSVI